MAISKHIQEYLDSLTKLPEESKFHVKQAVDFLLAITEATGNLLTLRMVMDEMNDAMGKKES